jgi:RNA recognition motif-containing protein
MSADGAEDVATVPSLFAGDADMTICVGHLACTTTEQDLRQLCEPYGPVVTMRRLTDRDTGRARSFGCVEMPDNRAAHSAMDALHGTSLAGRALTVNAARPREPRREPRQPRW